MINQIRSLIKRVISTKSCDNGPVQRTSIRYMGREINAQVLHPYGMYTSPPVGSIGVSWSASATETDQVAVIYSPEHYGKPLKETEVLLGNFVKNATLKFDAEGNAHLQVPKNVYVTCVDSIVTCSGNSTITCDSASISASSSFDVSAGASASITAPTIALNGSVTAPQGMAVTGGMTSEGIEVSKEDHKHNAGNLLDSSGGQCTGETASDA